MTAKQFIKVSLVASMAVLALASLSTVRAEDAAKPETIDVVASGVGMNETEATKDALGNAVRRAIGAIVGTDSLVQNEEVVRDQILTYSDGFVEKYDVVGKPSTALNGLTSVTIRARIVRNKLIQKAKAANIYVVEVDGKGLFAEAVTKIEQKKSALALITDEFKDMPQQLITAEIVGKPRYDEDEQQAIVTAKLAVDPAAYAAFVGRLTKILDGIGGPSFTISSTQTYTRPDSDSGVERLSEIHFPEAGFPEKYVYSISGWQDQTYTVLAVCTTHNSTMTSSQWRMYILEPSVMKALNAQLNSLSIGVEVLDGSNKVIDCRYLPLGKVNNGRHYEGPITFDSSSMGDSCHAPQLFIAPFVNGQFSAARWFNTVKFDVRGGLTATRELQFNLKPDDLVKVSKIVCKVSPVGSPTGE